ncbi:MAG: hypothetical protein J0M34_02600 [Alphaproteobacteria bacterium]|nr:hypothetical protein [Alphaproteobacteria bacterium]
MATKKYNDRLVRKGDISTYVHASDAWLEKRKKELRGFVNEPDLTPPEIADSVALPVTVAGVGAGWTVWQALEIDRGTKWLSKFAEERQIPWLRKLLTTKNGKVSLLYNADEYKMTLRNVSQKIADFHVRIGSLLSLGDNTDYIEKLYYDIPGNLNPKDKLAAQQKKFFESAVDSGLEALDAIIEKPAKLGHKGALPYLEPLRTELREYVRLNGKTGQTALHIAQKLMTTLEHIHTTEPQMHVSKYYQIWQSDTDGITHYFNKYLAKSLNEHNPIQAAKNFANSAIDACWPSIKESANLDNKAIRDRIAKPATLIAAAAAMLVIGVRSYFSSRKQQLLEWETEASFIERLQDERAVKESKHDREHHSERDTGHHTDKPAKTHKERVAERRHATSHGDHAHSI